MDNILIFAKTREHLEQLTKQVLQWLRDNDLYLKPKKCEFSKERIEYLGMVIQEGKITMDSVKLKGIQDWPVPSTVKQVQSFLGFGNFYRKFIHKFSKLARPLNDLLKKDKTFEWTVGNPQGLRMEPAYPSFISFQFYYIIISFLALIHFRPHILYATHATGPHTFYSIVPLI